VNVNTVQPVPCPVCATRILAQWFPAIMRSDNDATASRPSAVSDAVEASCFYHPAKQAAIVCENCGRFLCSLCDIELAGDHLCSHCIEAGKRKATLGHVEKSRTLWDEIALALSILPLLAWPVTVITAPATLFFVFRHWNRPLSIIPRTKIRYVLAVIFASLQIVGWTVFGYHLLT